MGHASSLTGRSPSGVPLIETSASSWLWVTAIHLAATWFLVGLIWVIQVVHYPSFDAIERERYGAFQQRHMNGMGAVVGLPWLIEGIAVLAVFFTAPDRTSLVLAGIGGVLEAIVIAVTVLRSIPAHERLTSGYDADAHRRLVQTNWLRTGAWSARGLIAIALVVLAAT